MQSRQFVLQAKESPNVALLYFFGDFLAILRFFCHAANEGSFVCLWGDLCPILLFWHLLHWTMVITLRQKGVSFIVISNNNSAIPNWSREKSSLFHFENEKSPLLITLGPIKTPPLLLQLWGSSLLIYNTPGWPGFTQGREEQKSSLITTCNGTTPLSQKIRPTNFIFFSFLSRKAISQKILVNRPPMHQNHCLLLLFCLVRKMSRRQMFPSIIVSFFERKEYEKKGICLRHLFASSQWYQNRRSFLEMYFFLCPFGSWYDILLLLHYSPLMSWRQKWFHNSRGCMVGTQCCYFYLTPGLLKLALLLPHFSPLCLSARKQNWNPDYEKRTKIMSRFFHFFPFRERDDCAALRHRLLYCLSFWHQQSSGNDVAPFPPQSQKTPQSISQTAILFSSFLTKS